MKERERQRVINRACVDCGPLFSLIGHQTDQYQFNSGENAEKMGEAGHKHT